MLLLFKSVTLLMFGMLLGGELSASQTYWLSDTPPTKEIRNKMRFSHGGLVQTGRGGVSIKRIWLREGEDPRRAKYVGKSGARAVLIDTQNAAHEIALKDDGYAEASFQMPVEGFYNLFMIGREVENSVLNLSIAKSEVLKHSCREGHDGIKEKMPPKQQEAVPIDIVRQRLPKESFHTRLSSGDEIRYRILHYGKPLEGANVTVVTQHGWKRSMKSDADGIVSFQMIRDYYPDWHEFKRRKTERFLLIAEHTEEKAGTLEGNEYKNICYKATVPGSYYPSARDYQSYAYGLLIGIFALFATGLSVYIYRRRRQKVYKEQRLD